uniref:Uncharacterized protein n=1 Tax=Caenorhabditis japonica TaxID=281687 RepID=A0A8R1I7H8_CAEJA
MSLPYIFLCFPRDKRLTVYQQIEANEHARYMYQFMEQRREQFKIQQQADQMQEFHGQQRPNRSHRKRRRNKNHQQKNVNYQPGRQVPVKVKLTFVQPQPKSLHYQPSFVQHQPIRQAPVKATKPIIRQCQPSHQQPKYNNYQPARQAPVQAKPSFNKTQPRILYYQPSRQGPIKAAKPIISQCQPKHQKAADSGVGSSLNSGNRSPAKLVPNPFYTCPPPVSGATISPTGVKLVPNPFYTGPPTTCKPIVSPTGVKLVPNPFYHCPV